MTPRILSIAGSDSGGGAGIQADVRTISALGGHAMTAITAITAQNTLGVSRVDVLPVDAVIAQINAVIDDIGVDAIKIGMLGTAEIAHAVATRLVEVKAPIVFDPVMVSTSGAALADDDTIAAFRQLIGISAVVTPNLPEWERLGADRLLSEFDVPFLLKGGHGNGDRIVDRLLMQDEVLHDWSADRIDTRHNHGTGCTLSSAIATHLGARLGLVEAIGKAGEYVRASLRSAPGFGAGHGPMGIPAPGSY